MISFKIEQLFGMFNYEFDLKDNGITILTGPNGFGKTTILKCLEAFSNIDKFSFFDKLDFKIISIKINDKEFAIEKINENTTYLRYEEKKCNLYDIYEYNKYLNDNITIKNISIRISTTYRTSPSRISPKIRYRIKKLREEYEIYIDIKSHILKRIGNVHHIKDNRSINGITGTNNIIYSINNISNRLKYIIYECVNEYNTISNELSRTYPERLLYNNIDEMSEEEFQYKMNEMREKQNILYGYDFFEKNDEKPLNFDEKYTEVLKIYFDDFNKKYAVYEDLINNLNLFTEIINNGLFHKEIKISKDDGIKIICPKTKKIVKLNSLSSGEKHRIILFFELIFNVKKGESITILIDEPELSMHVAWQENFIKDLKRIQNKEMNVIIATHSPFIIGEYEDNQIDLGELFQNANDR